MEFENLSITVRETKESIAKVFASFSDAEYIQKIVDSLPYVGAILNQSRQVIFANHTLLEILGYQDFDRVLGKRPGELLNCINSTSGRDGCGTSRNCSVCGALNSIVESQIQNKKVIKDCLITGKENDVLVGYEFRVTSTPFDWNNEIYTIFSMVDISSEKRRLNMERIFYHDILNKTSSIYGFLELIKLETDRDRLNKFIDILNSLNHDLTDEIKSQRALMEAENNILKLSITEVESLDILENAMGQIKANEVAIGKSIIISNERESYALYTDGVVLRRIIMNMIKNALEASVKGQKIEIGADNKGNTIRFWVQNETIIPEDIKLQIFQRSFSTKGATRGLGTYSMKILGENYLKGKADFLSDSENGTIFYLDIPVNFPE